MSTPNVAEKRMSDPYIQVAICWPGADYDDPDQYHSYIDDVFDHVISFNEDGSGALSFSTYKDSPGQALLHEVNPDSETPQREWTLAIRIWDPRAEEWVEPDFNARFMVGKVEDNLADQTNLIRYHCVQEPWVLNRMVLGKHRNADRLNAELDAAREVYEDREREYDQLIRQADNLGTRIQEDRFGGINDARRVFSGYLSLGHVLNLPHGNRWGMITASIHHNGIFAYRPSTRQWLRLAMSGSDTDNQRADFLALSPQVRTARTRMNNARDAYARAERAARETSSRGTRYFYHRTPARALSDAWVEGGLRDSEHQWAPRGGVHDRLFAKGFWRDWMNERDSKGRPWLQTTDPGNWEFPLGLGFLDMLNDYRERGLIDWCQRRSTISMVPAGGLEVDQSGRIALRIDQMESAKDTFDRTQHHSQTLVLTGAGDHGDAHMLEWRPGMPTNATPHGRWEASVSEPDAQSRGEAIAWTRKLRQDAEAREVIESSRTYVVNGLGPIPMLDFTPHHWISLYDHEDSISKRKVSQIVLRMDDKGQLLADIKLGTRRKRQFTQFYATLAKTVSGVDHIQGHIPAGRTPDELTTPEGALYAPPVYFGEPWLRFDERADWAVVLPVSWGDPGSVEPDSVPTSEPEPIEDDGGDDQ